ncbi:unnamed protein product [Linum tenue]|uniref:Pentatricopeptide repeat-containing protein n=1 Tax=Linum tenue TaxID=586396 RepID=A0AAV0PB27_9ROSI|nr:unnamed protein product [Linum tenue]
MSSLARVLRRAYCTATTTAATTTTTAAAVEPSLKALSESLYKERSLKRLVQKFKKSSVDPRFRTKIGIYEDVIHRLASAKCFNWIEEVLEDQKRFKDISKEGFNARLISLYGKAGMLQQAQQVFDEMPSRNCKQTGLSFNALLAACLNSKKLDKVDELFKELPKKLEIQPDVVSYNTLMKAYCQVMGSINSGVKLLDEMEAKGLVPNLITYNTLLSGLYTDGRLEDGDRVWEKMVGKEVSPGVRTYNAKLLGLSSMKRMKEAVELHGEMKTKEFKPDAVSFGLLIKGFIKEGNLEEVKRMYAEMQEAGFKPDRFGFARLVSFAYEKGDVGFASEVAKDIFKAKRLVEEKLLQRVVDCLAKKSKREEAEEVVQLGNNCGYFHYKLKVPTEE